MPGTAPPATEDGFYVIYTPLQVVAAILSGSWDLAQLREGEGEKTVEREASIARRTLQKARFFLTLAEQDGIADRDAFVYCFEAAIVFGRSIPHHLRKQYIRPDKPWCRTQLKALETEPLVTFFVSTRDFIIHQGEVGIRRAFEVTPQPGHLTLSGSVTVRLARGAPWYKRSPRILWGDSVRAVLRPWRKWREARQEKGRIAALQRESQRQEQTPPVTRVRLYFASDDPAVKGRPAVELVYEYLRRLEKEIDTFDERFGESKGR